MCGVKGGGTESCVQSYCCAYYKYLLTMMYHAAGFLRYVNLVERTFTVIHRFVVLVVVRQFGLVTSLWKGGRKCSYVLCWSNSLHYTLNLENRCAPDIPNRTRRPLLIVISYFLRLHRQGEITSSAPNSALFTIQATAPEQPYPFPAKPLEKPNLALRQPCERSTSTLRKPR